MIKLRKKKLIALLINKKINWLKIEQSKVLIKLKMLYIIFKNLSKIHSKNKILKK